MTKTATSGGEVRAARERMALSHAQLAVHLGLTEAQVRAWEAGTTTPPRGAGQNLAHLLASHEQNAAIEAAGLPACTWEPESDASSLADFDGVSAMLKRIEQHAADCPVCQARERYIREHCPALPEPYKPPLTRLVLWIARHPLPRWLRPAALGAAALFLIVAARMLFTVVGYTLGGKFPGFGGMLPALLAATGAGAFGGLAYSAVRPTLRRLGRPGDYLTGIVCVTGYMAALAVVAPIAFGEEIAETKADWAIMLAFSVFFGLVVGYSWFRPNKVATSEAPPA